MHDSKAAHVEGGTGQFRTTLGVPPKVSPRLVNWKAHLDLVRVSLFGLILVSVSTVHMYLGPLRIMRPALLLLALSFMAAFHKPRTIAWKNIKNAWPPKAVLLLLIIAIGSAMFGLSMGQSASYILSSYSRVLILFFLLVAAIRGPEDLAILMWAFVSSIAILIILSMTVLDLQPTFGGLARLEASAMYDANDLGMLFLTGLPLALLFYFNSGRFGRLVSLFVIFGVPVAIAFTGSRGAFVGLLAVGPALFFVLSRIHVLKRLGGVLIVGAGLAIGAPDGYWEQMQTILTPTEDYNYTYEYGRREIAKRGVGYMLAYPVFGVGISNFGRAEGTISVGARESLTGTAVRWMAPHNTYVQIGAELGAFALAIWTALLVGGTVGLWDLRRQIPASWEDDSPERRFLREATLFLPVSFLAFAVTSFLLSHAYTAPIYILIAFMSGVFILSKRELRRDQKYGKLNKKRAVH